MAALLVRCLAHGHRRRTSEDGLSTPVQAAIGAVAGCECCCCHARAHSCAAVCLLVGVVAFTFYCFAGAFKSDKDEQRATPMSSRRGEYAGEKHAARATVLIVAAPVSYKATDDSDDESEPDPSTALAMGGAVMAPALDQSARDSSTTGVDHSSIYGAAPIASEYDVVDPPSTTYGAAPPAREEQEEAGGEYMQLSLKNGDVYDAPDSALDGDNNDDIYEAPNATLQV